MRKLFKLPRRGEAHILALQFVKVDKGKCVDSDSYFGVIIGGLSCAVGIWIPRSKFHSDIMKTSHQLSGPMNACKHNAQGEILAKTTKMLVYKEQTNLNANAMTEVMEQCCCKNLYKKTEHQSGWHEGKQMWRCACERAHTGGDTVCTAHTSVQNAIQALTALPVPAPRS